MKELTEKQKNFVKAYLEGDLKGIEAVIKGYPNVKNRNTAAVMAFELLRKPKIKRIVARYLNKEWKNLRI